MLCPAPETEGYQMKKKNQSKVPDASPNRAMTTERKSVSPLAFHSVLSWTSWTTPLPSDNSLSGPIKRFLLIFGVSPFVFSYFF